MLLCQNRSTKLKYYKNNNLIMVETENLLIDALQRMNLNYEEAQIYFTLLKYGKSGTIVRKLREELHYIERTTIYSILRRLIEKGCVNEEKSSKNSKRLKNFLATDPTEYFNTVFTNKKQEFEELKEIKNTILKNLQNLYIQGLKLTDDDLDPFILPYFQSLLNKGWKVLTQKINKGINILGSEIFYEYHISHPNYLEKKIAIVGIIISLYDSPLCPNLFNFSLVSVCIWIVVAIVSIYNCYMLDIFFMAFPRNYFIFALHDQKWSQRIKV